MVWGWVLIRFDRVKKSKMWVPLKDKYWYKYIENIGEMKKS